MWGLLVLVVSHPTGAAAEDDYVSELRDRARAAGLAQSAQWHRFLHYRSGVWGGFVSDIDSPEFFIAEEGKTDPQAELDATLAAFFAPAQEPPETYDPRVEHPQCRFIARYQWLRDTLNFDPQRLEPQKCHHFSEWRKAIRAESATLIFASAYLNNPASMFGHTLLRLNRSSRAGAHLTSYVVNYAAEPWTTNPLIYTVLGLSGGFDARFSTMPFYLKTREYTDMENRELWEYDLNFTQDEIDRMVRHLWELQPVSIDYYYFDENCSFHLLSLLEAARPSLTLTNEFAYAVIPADTVREVLAEEDMLVERRLRHSRRSEMMARRERLSADERALARRIGAGQDDDALESLAEQQPQRQAAILDAGLAYYKFLERSDELSAPEWEQKLLMTRGQLGIRSEKLELEEGSAPETGHGTAQVSLFGGASTTQDGFVEIGVRPALHDIAAPRSGYSDLSQIEFLDLRIRALGIRESLDDFEVILQRLNLIEIVSLAPLDSWDTRWSWAVGTGFGRVFREQCPRIGCFTYDLNIGFGAAFDAGPFVFYGLLDGELALGEVFDYFTRISFGPRLGSLLRIGHDFARLHLEASYRYPVLGEDFPDARPRLLEDSFEGPPFGVSAILSVKLLRNLEARIVGTGGRGPSEASFGLNVYF